MEPLISVIIPVYNVEPYLERCLDSVLDNTYKNLEIICVNDGSPDNCQQILERYAAQGNRIKVIVQENRGLSAARNTGIEAASGEYLYYADSDDWIHKQSFELLVHAAEASGADMIVGGYMEVENPNRVHQDDLPQHPKHTDKQSVEAYMLGVDFRVTVWGTLYRRSKVQNIRFPDKKGVSEDNIYHTLILSEVENVTVVRLPIPLYYYYVARADSIMKTATADVFMRNAKWLTEELAVLNNKQYALDNILSFLFSYSYSSRFYANRSVAKQNIRTCFKELQPYLRRDNLTYKQIAKAFIVRYLQFSHRKIMIMRDKTYLLWETHASHKCKNVYLKDYLDL